MEFYLKKYLNLVGITNNVTASLIHCEICGYKDFEALINNVKMSADQFVKLPIVACKRCCFIMQNPRFNKEFYDRYYYSQYRKLLFGNTKPQKDFIVDQMKRGEYLFRNLVNELPKPGNLLDVGCSAGGLMLAFAKRDWNVFGTDPDFNYTQFGREKLQLAIETVSAEEMKLPEDHYDLIIITGSLEHVYDVNTVLNLCYRACSKTGYILIEGHALNYGIQQGFFSHNHRRYLTINSIKLLMLKHGWNPVWENSEAICGPSRPGGIYVLGKIGKPISTDKLLTAMTPGNLDNLYELKARLATIHYLSENKLESAFL